jgi:hypothetical protein
MTSTHPLALELARYSDNLADADEATKIRRHLETCPLCRMQLDRIAEFPAAAADELSNTHARATPAPGSPSQLTSPAPGEIRRLTWDDTAHLALIVRVDDDRVLGRPILPWGLRDLPICNELECKLETIDISLPVLTVGVWFRHGVVDTTVGRCLEPTYFADDVVTCDGLRGWLIEQVPGFDATTDLLDEFADDIDTLEAGAQWTPLESPAAPDLNTLIDAGLDPGRALDVVRGDALSDDEARRIADVTGVTPVTPVPVNVRRLLDHPRFKHRLRDRAASRGVSEGDARTELAAVLRQPIAARTSDGAPLTLEQRLESLLE